MNYRVKWGNILLVLSPFIIFAFYYIGKRINFSFNLFVPDFTHGDLTLQTLFFTALILIGFLTFAFIIRNPKNWRE